MWLLQLISCSLFCSICASYYSVSVLLVIQWLVHLYALYLNLWQLRCPTKSALEKLQTELKACKYRLPKKRSRRKRSSSRDKKDPSPSPSSGRSIPRSKSFDGKETSTAASAVVSGKFSVPPVSILKPLKGLNSTVEENLRSFFVLTYPCYEIVICVDSESDPAYALGQKLMKEFPNVDARISVGFSHIGVNPKICNMQSGYESMKYDLFWIADANIVASDHVIYDFVKHSLDPTVGIVHQLPWVINPKSTASELDRWYFVTSHGKPYLIINTSGFYCVNGMSTMMSKTLIDKAGGLKHFAQYLAEDAEFGFYMEKEGLKQQMLDFPGIQNQPASQINSFFSRRIRWKKLCYNLPAIQVSLCFEFYIEGLCSYVAALAWCIHASRRGFSLDVPIQWGAQDTVGGPALFGHQISFSKGTLQVQWWWFIFHVFAWFLVDVLHIVNYNRCTAVPSFIRVRDYGIFRNPFLAIPYQFGLWTFRELSTLVITVFSLINVSQVSWGGKTFSLRQGRKSAAVQQVDTKKEM